MQDAMELIFRQPVLEEFGRYRVNEEDDERPRCDTAIQAVSAVHSLSPLSHQYDGTKRSLAHPKEELAPTQREQGAAPLLPVVITLRDY